MTALAVGQHVTLQRSPYHGTVQRLYRTEHEGEGTIWAVVRWTDGAETHQLAVELTVEAE